MCSTRCSECLLPIVALEGAPDATPARAPVAVAPDTRCARLARLRMNSVQLRAFCQRKATEVDGVSTSSIQNLAALFASKAPKEVCDDRLPACPPAQRRVPCSV